MNFIFAADWWNSSYEYRDQINVSTAANSPYNGYKNYTVQITLNTTNNSYYLSSGNDLRVVWWNGSSNFELNRELLDNNSANSRIRFMLQKDISASSNDSNYYFYYSNPSAGTPPTNLSKVYLWYDDASIDRESEYTQGRIDATAHGGNWRNSISWNAAGYYNFDTGDNYVDSLRPSSLSERDIYVEYSEYQTAAYPNDMTSGPILRWQGTGSGGTEDSSHFYYYEMGESLLNAGSYPSHDDITHDSRSNVAITYGTLGFFPTATWIRLGIASWGINPTNINAYYENESGGFNGYRFTGTHAAGSDNEGSGQFGLWVQQDGGRLDNIIARRYTEPEPTLNNFNTEKYSSELSIEIFNASTTSTNYIQQNSLLNVTAKVSCSQSYLNNCGNVSIISNYNDSDTTFTNISTIFTTPVWTTYQNPNSCVISGGSNCFISWLVNATGSINSNHILNVFVKSNMSITGNSTSDNIDLSISGSFAVAFNQSTFSFEAFTKNSGIRKTNLSVKAILGDNTNLTVICSSGNCSKISENWIDGTNLNESSQKDIEFSCSDSSFGNFWAIFSLSSNEFNSSSLINVSCTVNKIYGPIGGEITIPIEESKTKVAQNKTFTLKSNMTCVGNCGNVSALLVIERGKTGLSSSDPGDSGWQIKQDYPNSPSAIYWIKTQAMPSAQQIFVDMDYDGGGWMLVGRGRESWSFSDAQQGTFADVANIPNGISAFSVDHYSSSDIDDLLNNTDVSSLIDGVRIRRANDTIGTTWQEGIWNFTSVTNWDWDFDGGTGLALSNYILDGIDYGSDDTQDARSASTDKTRTRTVADGEHNSQAGFQYGDNVCDGANTPTNYMWEYVAECNALPFTQVYIRPHYRDNIQGKIPSTYNKPLYVVGSNVQSCIPNEDGSCLFTWLVNATGDIGTISNLTVIYSSNLSQISNNKTGHILINISTNIEPTVFLISPLNQSKILNTNSTQLKWYVEDDSSLLTCNLYINSIYNQSINCTSGTNTTINISLNPGKYNWSIEVDDNLTKVNSSVWNFILINSYWSKILKEIKFENTDIYKINLTIENKLNNKNNLT
ncbi:MAG: hypothetical protein KC550_00515, partial [Nanoarchaeota archaeon]|nr:hypothetical protein [Nanoarchaeota archaeon]